MALSFRLFGEDSLRVRALTLISTVGLVGLAIGPTVGGLVLAIAPWPVLLLINATIVTALVAPTLFVNEGSGSWMPWPAAAMAVVLAILFIVRQRSARYPLIDLELDWGWSPAHAAIGMLPQVIVLLAAGPFVSRSVELVGFEVAAWSSAAAVVVGLAVYSLFGSLGYIPVAIALVLVAAGMRVNGVVAGTKVLRGRPENRTSIGSALVDTATELASGVSVAVAGTILAALFTGRSPPQPGAPGRRRSSSRPSRSRGSNSPLWRHCWFSCRVLRPRSAAAGEAIESVDNLRTLPV